MPADPVRTAHLCEEPTRIAEATVSHRDRGDNEPLDRARQRNVEDAALLVDLRDGACLGMGVAALVHADDEDHLRLAAFGTVDRRKRDAVSSLLVGPSMLDELLEAEKRATTSRYRNEPLDDARETSKLLCRDVARQIELMEGLEERLWLEAGLVVEHRPDEELVGPRLCRGESRGSRSHRAGHRLGRCP